MNKVKEFSDRRGGANKSKDALLTKFRAAASAPDLATKLAARAIVAEARNLRHAARDAEKLALQQRLAAEADKVVELDLLRKAAEAEAIEAKQSAQERRIALVLSDEAARKSARDLRYAQRKAAQKIA